MSDRAEFLRKWRGTPYDEVERNCWWLLALAQAELFGRYLPCVDPGLVGNLRERARVMATHPLRGEWVQVSRPEDGAAVLMGRTPGMETHCGIYLKDDGGLILHTDVAHGVVVDPPADLAFAMRWRLLYLIPK